MALPQAVANPTRTGVQLGGAAVITEFIDAFWIDFDDRQYAAFLAALVLLISVAQNLYEQAKGKYFLKPTQLD